MYIPKYTITNPVLKFIGHIEACKEVIDHAPLLPHYERQFREDALIRTVHYGTHLEGNSLDLDQAEKVMKGGEVVARQRDIVEVINYRKAMDFIAEARTQSPQFTIDETLIKKLHKLTVDKIMPAEKCGVYRQTQVVVKNSLTGEVSFRPPTAAVIPFQIDDLFAFVNDTSKQEVHPVLKSGIVHYEFVRIHPFLDGNGRVARALSTLILFEQGYDIRQFFSLEEYFDSDANRYYEALQSVEKLDGDVTRWLEYFTEGLAVELSKIKEKIESISADVHMKQRLGGQPILLSERQLQIIEYIQKMGYLQNKGFKSLFPMVSEDTVLNEIKGLVKAGIIKKSGTTKGAKYVKA
jgi:Fic family protein